MIMNFTIRIYNLFNTTCSFVGASLTTCSTEEAVFGNYGIHISEFQYELIAAFGHYEIHSRE